MSNPPHTHTTHTFVLLFVLFVQGLEHPWDHMHDHEDHGGGHDDDDEEEGDDE